ncbi:esterase AGAP003155 [Phlebotomus argentipes]|uniref:esterase AGAP003155 n=1 Tax=Phlebotomus argentipes TaxID=94469 RepID=UPI00289350DA|nr:esterase AGAP003155 [Phlebotomus argentipes]
MSEEDSLVAGSSSGVEIQSKDRLRVLCIHGYRQNEFSFRSKLGSFRKYVDKYAEFVFITAPHQAPPFPGEEDKPVNENQKSWWFNKPDGSFRGIYKGGPVVGFEESLRLVEKTWEEQGPFHGILGFSQGGCFVGLLCHLAERGMITTLKPQFAVIASGFRSLSLAHLNYYENTVKIPSLHIYGENDDIIPTEMSETLASGFENKIVVTHAGGHYFPATAAQKMHYVDFFRDRLQTHLEALELENH